MKNTTKLAILLIWVISIIAGPSTAQIDTLTNGANQSNSTYWPYKIDLNKGFYWYGNVYFGDHDAGEGGIVFTIHNDTRGVDALGCSGEGLGFAANLPNLGCSAATKKVNPAVGIKIDTHQNILYGEPEEDHTSIITDGKLNLNTTYTLPNLEDGNTHEVYLIYDASSSTLKLWIDDDLIFEELINLAAILGDEAWFGISAGSGDDWNYQWVENMVVIEDFILPIINHPRDIEQYTPTISIVNGYVQVMEDNIYGEIIVPQTGAVLPITNKLTEGLYIVRLYTTSGMVVKKIYTYTKG